MQEDRSALFETLDQFEELLLDFEDHLAHQLPLTDDIHLVFRAAHNLKSGLAMANLPASSQLIHVIENQFDDLRNGRRNPSKELLDWGLKAADLIKLNLVGEGESSQELERLTSFIDNFFSQPLSSIPSTTEYGLYLTIPQKLLIDEAMARGEHVYVIEKLISTTISEDDFKSLLIFDDIREVGRLLVQFPDFELLNRNQSETVLSIIFASDKTIAELETMIFDPFHEVSLNQPKQILRDFQGSRQWLHILVVEDELTTRLLLRNMLSEYGICDGAVNGIEGWEAWRIALEKEVPYHLVFLDIKMDGLNGIELLKKIRDREKKDSIYGKNRTRIVMCTGVQDINMVFATFRLQSDGYIIKPVSKLAMTKQIRKLNLFN